MNQKVGGENKLKFKAGDKIRMLVTCSDCEQGQVYTLSTSLTGELVANYLATGTTGFGGCSCQSKWELVSSKSIIMKLSNLARKLLDADTKVLIEAGILDSELEVTEEGTNLILSHYVNANKKVLAEEAKKLLKENEEEE